MHREMMDIAFSGNGVNLFSFAPKRNRNRNVDEMQDNIKTDRTLQQGLTLHHP
jgi:hypothetical protein